MSDEKLDWQKNVKRIECKKTTFNTYYQTKLPKKQLYTNNLQHRHDISQNYLKDKYFINVMLDLHNYSIDNAYHKLIDFIIENYQMCNRCLLVVTGHSSTINETETIKSSFNTWLNNPKIQHMILSCKQAAKKHGGKGAFYILLRRNINLT
ncbi:hypothetical protein BIY23_04670 [Wolbachia pipientis]|uniref:Smr domain-containing protein n=1 Tax=Wolbachia pipientis TaxID=955 RepID=A0A1E7QKV5_WOLPI|nr:Smr/MutS family protein [Wolbachia pipientis]OEY86844.1 hypothetical protein BIY23_04670 [Wolbachia pipientis]